VLVDHLQRLGAVARLDGVVALTPQRGGYKHAEIAVVVGDQNEMLPRIVHGYLIGTCA
jgi:hypothetical protein